MQPQFSDHGWGPCPIIGTASQATVLAVLKYPVSARSSAAEFCSQGLRLLYDRDDL